MVDNITYSFLFTIIKLLSENLYIWATSKVMRFFLSVTSLDVGIIIAALGIGILLLFMWDSCSLRLNTVASPQFLKLPVHCVKDETSPDSNAIQLFYPILKWRNHSYNGFHTHGKKSSIQYSQYCVLIHMRISVNEGSALDHRTTRTETLLCWNKKEFHPLVQTIWTELDF